MENEKVQKGVGLLLKRALDIFHPVNASHKEMHYFSFVLFHVTIVQNEFLRQVPRLCEHLSSAIASTLPSINPSTHIPSFDHPTNHQAKPTTKKYPPIIYDGSYVEPQRWEPDQSKSYHPRDCDTRGKPGCSCSQSRSLHSAGATSPRTPQRYSVVPW